MSDASVNAKLKNVLPQAVLENAEKARQRDKKKETPKQDNAAIKENTFFKIVFDPATTLEQKRDEWARVMLYSKDSLKLREELLAFNEWKHAEDTEMSEELIGLTDTEAFAVMYQSTDDMNRDLNAFYEKIRPMSEILQSVYNLRAKGVIFDSYNDIMAGKKREEEDKAFFKAKGDRATEIEDKLRDYEVEIAAQKQKTGWMGGIKASAANEIVKIEKLKAALKAEASEIETDVKNRKANQVGKSQLEIENAADIANLRKMLDLTSDEHKKNQEELVNMGLAFVKSSKERSADVSEHFKAMTKQVDRLGQANSQMLRINTIIHEGMSLAEKQNLELRSQFAQGPADENALAKLDREEKLGQVDEHIDWLKNSTENAAKQYAALGQRKTKVTALQQNVTKLTTNAREMQSAGVAAMADQLVVVLQSHSMSALAEASAIVSSTMDKMTDITNEIAMKEVVRNATGVQEENKKLERLVGTLENWSTVMDTTRDIQRGALTESRSLMDEIRSMTSGLSSKVDEQKALAAEILGEKEKV